MSEPQILATSSGFRTTATGAAQPGPLVAHALRLTGKDRPRFCYVGTAAGDDARHISLMYGAFAGRDDVIVSHLELFMMPNVPDAGTHLLSQDVIWVGGGSVANLLAVWRTHGLDEVFREAWHRGIVLSGVSAGSLCWHIGGTTDSFGVDLRPVTNGLALLPYSNGVHYNSEEQRRPLLHRLIGDEVLPNGYATDDGVGLHYVGTEFHEAVCDGSPGASAYWVERASDGTVDETTIEPRVLTE